jgi:DnaJ-domain-containing protein 1
MFAKSWTTTGLYGGVLALGLSYLTAHYFSTSLFAHYHDWSGWRNLTGWAPNGITNGLAKISWAVIFCSCWWMLWRLDFFLGIQPESNKVIREDKGAGMMDSENHQEMRQEKEEPQKSENFIPEEEEETEAKTEEYSQPEEDNSDKTKEAKKAFFPELEDLKMAEVLGLEKDEIQDFAKIKATYRIAIAQYHPDKVSALGLEIQEVAEKKAKEINQAYEYFRRKLKKTKTNLS